MGSGPRPSSGAQQAQAAPPATSPAQAMPGQMGAPGAPGGQPADQQMQMAMFKKALANKIMADAQSPAMGFNKPRGPHGVG